MRAFLDTNVLVYAEDAAEERKRDCAQALIATHAQDDLVLSTQVLAEFYATALRKRLCSPSRAQALCHLWSEREVVGMTATTFHAAVKLHMGRQLSLWDALVVQSAVEAGCSVLYTEDLQHGARFGRLEVLNPFGAHAVHEPRAAYRTRPSRRRPGHTKPGL